MDCSHRLKFFAALYVAIFVGAMGVCTNWAMGITTYASIPVILSAEAIVLGMLYATFFHDAEHAEHEAAVVAPRATALGRQEQAVQFGPAFKNRSAQAQASPQIKGN